MPRSFAPGSLLSPATSSSVRSHRFGFDFWSPAMTYVVKVTNNKKAITVAVRLVRKIVFTEGISELAFSITNDASGKSARIYRSVLDEHHKSYISDGSPLR